MAIDTLASCSKAESLKYSNHSWYKFTEKQKTIRHWNAFVLNINAQRNRADGKNSKYEKQELDARTNKNAKKVGQYAARILW